MLDETKDVEEAFRQSYKQVDEEYIRTGREMQDPTMLLTGTCAVGAYSKFLANIDAFFECTKSSRAVVGSRHGTAAGDLWKPR